MDIQAKVRSRPFIFGDPLRNKKPISVRISALPEETSSPVTLRLSGDGQQFQAREVTVSRFGSSRPRPTKIRMGGGKASALQLDVEFRQRIQLQGVEVVARLLGRDPVGCRPAIGTPGDQLYLPWNLIPDPRWNQFLASVADRIGALSQGLTSRDLAANTNLMLEVAADLSASSPGWVPRSRSTLA